MHGWGPTMLKKLPLCGCRSFLKTPLTFASSWRFTLTDPEYNLDQICSQENMQAMEKNIRNRKGVGDIYKVQDLYEKLKSHKVFSATDDQACFKSLQSDHVEDFLSSEETDVEKVKRELLAAIQSLPNFTHSSVPIGDESQAGVLQTVLTKPEFDFAPKSVVQLGHDLDCLRTQFLGLTTGQKTYYLKHGFADLQNALINYTTDYLSTRGFELVHVPEIVHPSITEAATGFSVSSTRTQVYELASPSGDEQQVLTGTGEIPLAAFFHNTDLSITDLPQKVMAVSRCFRAETSGLEEEQGIYRVHQFHKVEMFAVTAAETGGESQEMMDDMLSIQTDLFSSLGLHFRVLDMPSQELGAPACRKYDIETWMPHKKFWGEISSTSNCTDYQSRRLGIRYWDTRDNTKFAHTVNGTGCALPRMIMAIAENFQTKGGCIEIPPILHPYMGIKVLTPPADAQASKWIKLTKSYKEKASQNK